MYKKILRYLCIGVSITLAACTTTSPVKEDTFSNEEQLHRTGKFAVLVYDKTIDRNSDSVQGNFNWLSTTQQTTLDLSSPLGQVLARVMVYPDYAVLVRANQERLEASNPDALVKYVLGREFPVSGLKYWIRGEAMPNIAVEKAQYNEQKQLSQFVQAGWTVSLSEYDKYGPKRFHLLNNQTTERITIRIVMR
ncbi:lipoprotein insertase outer membrane protein LolB [Pelistega ratti]|uniref:lipoprotein insertase outer membrane protein LolB n=1 Tax=Pelistega ratti TaxID=2652177 RepID=UPI00135C308E|nr:lipoprotein insertase outer membrane protein LolB [Pelistega ratti]